MSKITQINEYILITDPERVLFCTYAKYFDSSEDFLNLYLKNGSQIVVEKTDVRTINPHLISIVRLLYD